MSKRLTPPALPLALALIGLTPLAAPPAQAQARAQQAFARIDANGDGQISQEEFLALRRQMFAAMDADGNGQLTKAEIESARARQANGRTPRSNQIWKQDSNGDGVLTLSEYTAQTRGFAYADSNSDGVLSQQEFTRIARFLAPAQ
ncbi:EF-hand domain-containing protein [Pseudodonghicola flavimaris]|uniref:EF-hand domain-containing protein n=1 Tax=Pseudodonghicola flavimaris TaxID=3050036 RepID=A0ABT7EUY6_9RHOB|nr:EF-hand domain-containing protein [Pseudodonghicola flavimaris]MDK3016159.1 EF-hand domain-containing protein [Pseudodonghicola flavimaris]